MQTATQGQHRLCIENGEALTASGVSAILSYDAQQAVFAIGTRTLTVGGEGLTVSELNVKTGEVCVQGSIEYLQYSEKKEPRVPFYKRLVR